MWYYDMSTNDEHPHLIDTKVYLFHEECHARVQLLKWFYAKVTQTTSPQCFGSGSMQAIALDDIERACTYCQKEAGKK